MRNLYIEYMEKECKVCEIIKVLTLFYFLWRQIIVSYLF